MEENEMRDQALRLDNQICFPLYATARKIINEYTPYLKPLGITYTQYLVFLVLWEKDDIKVGDLCERLYLDNGTLTPMLKKMEKNGFITRTRDSSDERVVVIRLTEEGRNLKEKAYGIPFSISGCFPLPAQEAKNLYDTLYKLLGMEKVKEDE